MVRQGALTYIYRLFILLIISIPGIFGYAYFVYLGNYFIAQSLTDEGVWLGIFWHAIGVFLLILFCGAALIKIIGHIIKSEILFEEEFE